MRSAIVVELAELAARDSRVVLLTGDLGFTVLEEFAERFPERFFNVGVAEQNMVGVATGLADAGFIPYVYSIATFATLRPYEFIRNGPLLHGLPVRVIGVGGGLDYGHNGVTHYALEDVAIMRAQPGMTVVAPADPGQARAALREIHAHAGPAYLRVGRAGEAVPGLDGRFRLGRLEALRDGDDVAVLALGSLATEALVAARALDREGIASAVAVAASLAPAPVDDLIALLSRVPVVVTVEAHYPSGGLGSLVAEVIAEHGLNCRLVRRAVQEMPVGVTGTPGHLHELHGLSGESIADTVSAALGVPCP
ncbi:MAG: 1-deoxy-D-xylulose-5-phosphate synthase [Actinomycetota bacterium]|nr:1-deoxy-D-xylulose-5-phosphate synthase [Actinomycetota bacterium]